MKHPPLTLFQRIGRRGAALLFFAILDLVYAFSLARPPQEAKRSTTLLYVQSIAPLSLWATMWAAVGVICLIGAFVHKDRWAFTCAMFIKVLWGVLYFLGWTLVGLERGYVSTIIWLAMAGWVGIISTWPEPPMKYSAGQDRPDPDPAAVNGGQR